MKFSLIETSKLNTFINFQAVNMIKNMEVEMLNGINHIKRISKRQVTSVRIYSNIKKTH